MPKKSSLACAFCICHLKWYMPADLKGDIQCFACGRASRCWEQCSILSSRRCVSSEQIFIRFLAAAALCYFILPTVYDLQGVHLCFFLFLLLLRLTSCLSSCWPIRYILLFCLLFFLGLNCSFCCALLGRVFWVLSLRFSHREEEGYRMQCFSVL